jgi:predicted nucleic-acid-binding protein
VRAVDANLLVRLVARDDPDHLRRAQEIMATGDVLVLPTVLLEAEWVLRSRYRIPRAAISDALTTLFGQAGVTVMSAEAVGSALAAYAQAGDFADLLHFALASEAGATSFVTFDRTFARPEEAGPDLQIL